MYFSSNITYFQQVIYEPGFESINILFIFFVSS